MRSFALIKRRFCSRKATFTSPIITGTSTGGRMTAGLK
jgi:hypothetical protein